MFSQNGKQPILTDFRGCFPHAERKIDVDANLSRKLKLFGSNYLYI